MTKKAKDSNVEMTEVLNCHRVPTKLYMDVQAQMYKQLNTLLPNRIYTLKQMCSKDFWKDMNSWQQRKAGRAFAHMVHVGIFHIEFVEHKSTSKRYQLK
jgi:hypothetical protein